MLEERDMLFGKKRILALEVGKGLVEKKSNEFIRGEQVSWGLKNPRDKIESGRL